MAFSFVSTVPFAVNCVLARHHQLSVLHICHPGYQLAPETFVSRLSSGDSSFCLTTPLSRNTHHNDASPCQQAGWAVWTLWPHTSRPQWEVRPSIPEAPAKQTARWISDRRKTHGSHSKKPSSPFWHSVFHTEDSDILNLLMDALCKT